MEPVTETVQPGDVSPFNGKRVSFLFVDILLHSPNSTSSNMAYPPTHRCPPPPTLQVLDLAAGHGRVVRDLLAPLGFSQVDLVEQSSKLLQAAKDTLDPMYPETREWTKQRSWDSRSRMHGHCIVACPLHR